MAALHNSGADQLKAVEAVDGKFKSEYEDSTGSLRTAVYEPGSEAERKFLRKMDLRIVPTIWLLYCLSYLDRANIGNARTGGMQAELGFTDNQYSIILLIFFVSYVIFEVPANMILTRVRPSMWLSGLCVLWGIVAMCMGFCHTWQQVAAVRFILGIAEAGFAPGVAFFLSSWYTRYEIAKRYCLYYTATAISGAFSGLLAGVFIRYMNGSAGYSGWRWLLIIEGAASAFVGLFTWLWLPDFPANTKFLSAEEKLLAAQRLAADNIASTQDEGANKPHGLQALKQGFTDWRILSLSLLYMLATGSQTIQYFIPSLVGQLGYTGFELQYHTIPIYVVAFVGIVTFCMLSDFRRERGNYITYAALLACISFVITVALPIDAKKAKYAFLCFAVAGVYAACPLTLMWVPNSIPHPAEKRAIAIALVNGLGNSASIYGSFLWPRTTAPRYTQGFAATAAFTFLLAIGAQVFKRLSAKYPYERLEDSQVHREKSSLA